MRTSKTGATLFSGGEGFGVGAQAAGLTMRWGVEKDPAIAAVGSRNIGHDLIVASVEDVDYTALEPVYWLHASTVCTRASSANTDAEESPLDLAMADATCRAIVAQLPPVFSLENVWAYREFESFKRIVRCLQEHGYAVEWWHLNSADYGVPQTRRRLILLASRVFYPQRPEPTHYDAKSGQASMFMLPWVGWYAAIEDLIPSLPRTTFAPWQLAKFEEDGLFETILMRDDNTKQEFGKGYRDAAGSAASLAANGKLGRAFIVHANDMRSMPVRDEDEPVFPVLAGSNGTHAPSVMPRAFVVDGQSNKHGETVTFRHANEPIYTISATGDKRPARAFLVPGANDFRVHPDDDSAVTIGTGGQRIRAWLSCGRVVRMTPRALARFQSFPDSYILPDAVGLAVKVIGNAVPPLLVQRLVESALYQAQRRAT